MKSDFLTNLNDALENGTFNSDASKKINEISELAEKKSKNVNSIEDLENIIKDRVEKSGGIKLGDENDVTQTKEEYENYMKKIDEENIANNQLALLIEVEEAVSASINDLNDFINDLEKNFENKKNSDNFVELFKTISEFKLKYEKFFFGEEN